MRAILYSVIVNEPLTTRSYDVYRPEIPLIKAGFPGIDPSRIVIKASGQVDDVDPITLWNRALRDHGKRTVETYSGNDPDVVPPAFEMAMQLAEAEADKLLALKEATPESAAAASERRKAMQEAIAANPEATTDEMETAPVAAPAPAPAPRRPGRPASRAAAPIPPYES